MLAAVAVVELSFALLWEWLRRRLMNEPELIKPNQCLGACWCTGIGLPLPVRKRPGLASARGPERGPERAAG